MIIIKLFYHLIIPNLKWIGQTVLKLLEIQIFQVKVLSVGRRTTFHKIIGWVQNA